MKRIVITSVLLGMLASGAVAQDDIYFVPEKKDKVPAAYRPDGDEAVRGYGGAVRDVDEYNRRGVFGGSYYTAIDGDTAATDVIDFYAADTTLVDTTLASVSADAAAGGYDYGGDEDYKYSRALSRYDDFYWYDPLYDPWAYGPYGWYGRPYGWYAGWWYDPWYAPWFYGPYRPWAWYYPTYVYVPSYRHYHGLTGTANHGRPHFGHRPVRTGYKGNRGESVRVTDRSNTFDANRRATFNAERQRTTTRRPFDSNRTRRQSVQRSPRFNNTNTFRPNRSGANFRSGGANFRSGGAVRGGGGRVGGRR